MINYSETYQFVSFIRRITKVVIFFSFFCALLFCSTIAHAQVSFQYEGAVPCLGASSFVNGGIEIVNPPAGAYTFEWVVTSPSGSVTSNVSNNPLGISFNEYGCWEVELFIDGVLEVQDPCGVEIFPDPVIVVDLVDVVGCVPFSPTIDNATFSPSGANLTYQWNLGICGTSSAENITPDFCTLNFAGVYPVSLLVEDSNGCFSQFSEPQAVYVSDQPPNVSFSQSSTIDCNLPIEVVFGSTSSITNSPATFTWEIDGFVQPELNDTLNYTFDTPGIYEVCLEVVDEYGCSDNYCSTVELFDSPAADFTFDPAVICAGMEVQFDNTSIPNPIPSVEWDFNGDGIVDATNNSPSHSYPSAGTYNAELTIAWSVNCIDSITHEVTVDPPIDAQFEIDTLWGCSLPFDIEIADLSSGTGVLNYDWFYIDQNNTNVPIVLNDDDFTFNNWGQYDVGLTLTNDIGCFDQFVFPQPVNLVEPQLVYYLTANSTCVGDLINTNITTNQSLDPFINWYYDIDCDGIIDQEVLNNTNGNTTFTFDAAGVYTVCLVAESLNGCSESSSATITIAPEIFSSFVVSDQTPCGIDFPLFEATNPDPDLTYEWFYGDGNSSGLGPFTQVEYSYCDTGFFDVTLIVSNAGCFTSSVIEDFIYVAPPIADFQIITNCDEYYSITFENNSILPDTTLLVWTIDGVDMYSGEWEPTHTFASEGVHEVTLYAENPLYSCSDTKTRSVKINEPTFEVDIGPTTGCPPVIVNIDPLDVECVELWQVQLEGGDFLQAQTGNSGWDLDWNVNGNSGSPNNQPDINWPPVSYTNIGVYSIGMTIVDGNGCQIDTLYQDIINVDIDPFFAQFDSVVTRYCDSTQVCVSPVLDGLSNFQWNTSTGLSSQAEDTCFMFYPPYNQNPGIGITLYAEDTGGCGSTVTDELVFAPQVNACFSISDDNPCKDEEVTLLANCHTCGMEPCTLNWDLDEDGVHDDEVGLQANFNSNVNGVYLFELEVIDSDGCVSVHTDSLSVHSPEITYDLTEDIFACQSVFNFTNTTEGPGISSYWYVDGFDDDGPIPVTELSNPSNQPQVASFTSSTIGVYNFYLETSNQYGCVADSSVTDFLNYGEDIGDFSCILDNIDCVPFEVSCEAFNINDTDFQYSWNMGDNTPFNATTVDHIYTSPGFYTISLTMTDTSNDCQFSVSGEEFEVTLLEYNFDGLSTVCPGDSSNFTVNNLDSLIWLSPLDQIFQVSSQEWYLTPGGSTDFVSIGYQNGCYAQQIEVVDNFILPVLTFEQFGPFCLNDGDLGLPTVNPSGGDFYYNDELTTNLNSATLGSGEHLFRYQFQDANGCISDVDVHSQINDTTTISFINPDICINGLELELADLASHNPSDFQIDYGSGLQNEEMFDPALIVDFPSTFTSYPLVFNYTNDLSCTSQLNRSINVHPAPDVAYSIDDVCEGIALDITQLSSIESGSISSYSWSFWPGLTSELASPENVSTDQAGLYNISLTATSDFGCEAELNQVVEVFDLPEFTITSNPSWCENTGGIPLPSILPQGGEFSWNGDVVASINTYELDAQGNDLTYDFTDDNNCSNELVITVELLDTTNISFVTPSLCFGSQPIELSDFSSHNPGEFLLAYDGFTFENSGVFDPQEIVDFPNVSEEYPIAYSFTNSEMCTSLLFDEIVIHPLPVPEFSISNACENTPVDFNFSNSIGSGSIDAFEWFINGDLVGIDEVLADSSFQNHGQYVVQLILESDQQCLDSLSRNLIIHPNPDMNLQVENVCFGEEVIPMPNGDVALGEILEYSIDWGDSSMEVFESSASHIYNSWGEYTMEVAVLTDQGCETDQSATVIVYPLPEAEFNSNNHCFGDPVLFEDSSVIAQGSIEAWAWNIAQEGESFITPSFNHVFAQPGQFEVELQVTSIEGCVAGASNFVQVFPSPNADFSLSHNPTCVGTEIELTNESTTQAPSVISEIQWQIDGVFYEDNPLELTFNESGGVDVQLLVTTDLGCEGELFEADAIEVHPLPVASFTLTPSSLTVVENIGQIIDLSEGAQEWEYQLSDGDSYFTSSPSHTFSDLGNYNILQIVANEFGCLDSAFVNVEVLPELIVYVPNAVTLDDDGLNELFYPVLYGDEIEEYRLTIWDRWGELLFISEDPELKWKGNVSNGDFYVQPGVYLWQLEVKGVNSDQQFLEGTVTVLR